MNPSTSKHSTVVGVFHDVDRAREAVRALRQAGFTESQISVLSRHDQGGRPGATPDAASSTAAGAATGAAVGAGAAALWSLGVSFAVLPAIGPILAAGPIAAALLSAVGGAAAGGLVGALVGTGMSKEEATYYEGEFKAGRTLVTVKADGRHNEAWGILQRHGAYCRDTAAIATTTGTAAAPAGAARTSAGGETIRLHEEELRARKEHVPAGEVRARKEVITEQKTMNVPVTREEVVVERHPASGQAAPGAIGTGEEIRIPVKEEQVRVEKTPVVKEEVTLKKRAVQDTEKVSGTVRKEELRVEEKGDPNLRTSEPPKTAPKR